MDYQSGVAKHTECDKRKANDDVQDIVGRTPPEMRLREPVRATGHRLVQVDDTEADEKLANRRFVPS